MVAKGPDFVRPAPGRPAGDAGREQRFWTWNQSFTAHTGIGTVRDGWIFPANGDCLSEQI